MAYQALYRVWRSQRFDELVGQETITQTLKNALMQHKTSHAYLFTGPRGTGKTSAAKIFAKAINCPHAQDGEPCNECDICQSITAGRLNDVLEIDAASNNGVEEIRDIREKVKYAPTQAEYKVYIIDEVHMLSTGAFNALLKTLEEPPANVVFILATTEPHKIPLTIISRTQRFDFKRISTQEIVTHLTQILDELKVTYESQSLFHIARAAEGGMRDALSILDQALSFGAAELTVADALQVTGSLTLEMMDQMLSQCIAGQSEEALVSLDQLLAAGKEGSRILEDLLRYCRDLLIYQQAPQLLVTQTGFVTESFKQLAQTLTAEKIYQLIEILSQTQNEIRFSNHPRIYLEVAMVKLANLPTSAATVPQAEVGLAAVEQADFAQLQQQVRQLSQELAALKNNEQAPREQSAAAKPASKPTTFRLPTEQVYQVLRVATRTQLDRLKDTWPDLLQLLTVTQRAMLRASEPVAASEEGLVVAFDYEILCQRAVADSELITNVQQSFERLIQYSPHLVFIPRESWSELRKSFIKQNQSELLSQGTSDAPALAEAEETVQDQAEQQVAKAVQLFGQGAVEVLDD